MLVPRPDGNKYKLSYRIVRPMALLSKKAAPIVVLHGGPSLPSNYLYPLEKAIPYRSVLFYDQIGCGQSDQPINKNLYSINAALDDLDALLQKLNLPRFHLYGHSFGGILAYEFLKREAQRNETNSRCLSCILSSTPTSIAKLLQSYMKLEQAIVQQLQQQQQQQQQDTTIPHVSSSTSISLDEQFRQMHQCRTPDIPSPLQEAYANSGTVWRGIDVIADWEATSNPSHHRLPKISCLILRGEYDFVTEECVTSWQQLMNPIKVRMKELKDCSHHGLLECESMYGEILDDFFTEFD
jgi:proline iminopeptidase